jgi:hypothetical protein
MATKTETKRTAGGLVIQYEARFGRSDAGSVKVKIEQAGVWKTRDHSLLAERLLTSRIYAICAELERRAGYRDARWPVSPRAMDGVIVIECEGHEVEGVEALLEEVIMLTGAIKVVR